jgi:hypothetical protein
MRAIAALVYSVGLVACGSTTLPLPLVGVEPLRDQATAAPGVMVACMEALASGVLDGDPTDPWRVWVVGGDGSRFDVVWPTGFGVRFTPGAEVVAGTGAVVAREGDAITLGGGFGQADVFSACEVNGHNWQFEPDGP